MVHVFASVFPIKIAIVWGTHPPIGTKTPFGHPRWPDFLRFTVSPGGAGLAASTSLWEQSWLILWTKWHEYFKTLIGFPSPTFALHFLASFYSLSGFSPTSFWWFGSCLSTPSTSQRPNIQHQPPRNLFHTGRAMLFVAWTIAIAGGLTFTTSNNGWVKGTETSKRLI